jgi:hypothetical protein
MKKLSILLALGGLLAAHSVQADNPVDAAWYGWRIPELQNAMMKLDQVESCGMDGKGKAIQGSVWARDCVNKIFSDTANELSNATYQHPELQQLKKTLEQAAQICSGNTTFAATNCVFEQRDKALKQIQTSQDAMKSQLQALKESDPQTNLIKTLTREKGKLKKERDDLKAENERLIQQNSKVTAQLLQSQKLLAYSKNVTTSCQSASSNGINAFRFNSLDGLKFDTSTIAPIGGTSAGTTEQK